MILLLFSDLVSLPALSRLIAHQSFSYLVSSLGMYTLLVVAPIIGMIQLASLRKQVRAYYARFSLSPEHQIPNKVSH
jgi:hypothetical protein